MQQKPTDLFLFKYVVSGALRLSQYIKFSEIMLPSLQGEISFLFKSIPKHSNDSAFLQTTGELFYDYALIQKKESQQNQSTEALPKSFSW